MSLSGENTNPNKIGNSRLPTLPRRFAAQVSGIDFPEPGSSFYEKLEDSNEVAPKFSLPLSLTVTSELCSLTGLSKAINTVRATILATDTITDHYDLDRKNAPKKRVITVNPEERLRLLSLKQKALHEYVTARVRIKIIRSALAQLPENMLPEYTSASQQLETWEDILSEITQNLEFSESKQELAILMENEWKKQSNNDQEIIRVKKLLSGERANQKNQEDQRPAQRLRQRVLTALLSKVGEEASKAVESTLIEELITTASTINDIRVQFRIENAYAYERNTYATNPESIRNRVEKIKEEYDQGTKNVDSLNSDLISVIIEVANILPVLFPHTDDTAPTSLSAILYRTEAVCAGKAEILASFFRNTGLKTKVIDVIQTMTGELGHALCEITLLGGKKLHVDTNYKIEHGKAAPPRNNKIESSELSNEVRYRKHQNAQHIRISSNVLLYTLEPIAKSDVIDDRYVCTMLNPDGTSTLYKTSVPFPHPLVSQQKESNINATTLTNEAFYLLHRNKNTSDMDIQEATKMLEMALQRDPNLPNIPSYLAEQYCRHFNTLGINKETAMQLALQTIKKPMKTYPEIARFKTTYISFLVRNHTYLGIAYPYNEIVSLWEEVLKQEDGLVRSEYMYKYAYFLSRHSNSTQFSIRQKTLLLLKDADLIATSKGQRKKIYDLQNFVESKYY